MWLKAEEIQMEDHAWDVCKHEWTDDIDSQFSNEKEEAVVCSLCWCPGARNIKTGTVVWPTT